MTGRRVDVDDAGLLRAHVRGDRDAFGELVRRHRDRLWAVALRTLADREDAADAVQEALLSAYRSADRFRGESAVTTWLHRIVVNACLDRARRRQARPRFRCPRSRLGPEGRSRLTRTTRHGADRPGRARPTARRAAGAAGPARHAGLLGRGDRRLLGVAEGTVKSRCARGRARLAVLLGHLRGSELDHRGEPGAAPDVGSSGAPTTRTGRCGMSPETHDLTWSELDRLADYTADVLTAAEAASGRRASSRPTRAGRRRIGRCAEPMPPYGPTSPRPPRCTRARCPTTWPPRSMPRFVGSRRDATVVSLDAARRKTPPRLHGRPRRGRSDRRRGDGRDRVEHRPDPSATGEPGDGGRRRGGPRRANRARGRRRRAGRRRSGAVRGGARVLASGTDYRLDTLAQLAAQAPPRRPRPNDARLSESPQFTAGDGARRAGPADRLRPASPTASGRRGDHPGVAVLLDYARFEGQPALDRASAGGIIDDHRCRGRTAASSGADEKAAVAAG